MTKLPPHLALALLLACGGCDRPDKTSSRAAAALAPATPTLAGRVTHAGAPVAGAFLVLSSRTTGEAPDVDPATLFTDAAGTFTLQAPADRYDVIVVADGLVAEAQVDLTGGARATLDLALRPFEVAAQDVERGALEALLAPDAALGVERLESASASEGE